MVHDGGLGFHDTKPFYFKTIYLGLNWISQDVRHFTLMNFTVSWDNLNLRQDYSVLNYLFDERPGQGFKYRTKVCIRPVIPLV